MLTVDIIPCLSDNYSYVISDTSKKLVGVIDPSEFTAVEKFISKKYNKLDFIFNTHHHFDHIGGNQLLKAKYGSKIVGSKIDQNKIPGIEILLNDSDNFEFGNTVFKIIFVPGHTEGHICFYSEKDKMIFTGDTLFSLGCGRIFEGTCSQMFASINKIKNLPKETKIFCGHEYTKKNLNFCLKIEKNNKFLKQKETWVNSRLSKNLPTIPATLEDELRTNIFLRCDNDDVKNAIKLNSAPEEVIFKKLRNLKDDF